VARGNNQIVFAFLAAIGGLAYGVAVGLALPLLFTDEAPATPKFRLAAPAIGGTIGFIIAGGLAARFASRVTSGTSDEDQPRRR
jgi:hypothetical protein